MSSSNEANGSVNLYMIANLFALFWLNSEFVDIEESVVFFILSFFKVVCEAGKFCNFTCDGLGLNSLPTVHNCHLPVTSFFYPVA